MDIRWKDGKGNILNANKEKIKYLTSENEKTTLSKEEVKKITIEDGLMNIFTDFKNELALTIVIPKKNKRDAVRIFNEYDKTGKMLKRKTGNFFIDLILDSSVVTFNPFTGIIIIITLAIALLLLFVTIPMSIFGMDLGLIVSRVLIIGALAYTIITRILIRIKRKRLKEVS